MHLILLQVQLLTYYCLLVKAAAVVEHVCLYYYYLYPYPCYQILLLIHHLTPLALRHSVVCIIHTAIR
jgi:hypothetical protein